MAGKSFFETLEFKFPPFKESIVFSDKIPPFRLMVEIKDDAETKVIAPADFSTVDIHTENGTTIINCKDAALNGTERISVLLKFARNDKEVIGTIEVEAEGGILVRQVQFPYIENHSVSHFDDLLMSSPWGDNIQRPVKTIKQYCLGKSDFWIYDYVKCTDDEVIYSYPSIMSMQYMTLHNKARSVYLACYGSGNDTMTFNARVIGKTNLALSINHYPFLENGSWKSPDCSFSVLKGDWHAASDLYADHMRDKFKTPDIPAWMKDDSEGFHGWIGIFMRLENQEPHFYYRDLPDVFRRAQELGLNTLQIAGWTHDGFDTLYPNFDIDPRLGTKEELRQAMDEIKAMGGHVILYINGRLVDGNSEFYKNGGDKSVCVDENGKPYIERYNTSAEFRIACPSCADYREYVAGRVRRIVGEFGAHAMQVDQISCNFAYFCYDKSHNHSTPANNYLPGIEKELAEIRKVHKAINPDFFVWCEGCHERFGQFYDVEQGHGEELTWQLGESVPEQFKYTFPDRLVTGISGSFQQVCHTYAQGKPFDLYIESLEDEDLVELLKSLVAVRRPNTEYFLRGIFRDSVGLEVNEGIRAFGIERSDGKGLLVNLWFKGAELQTDCRALLKHPREGWGMRTVYPVSLAAANEGKYIEITWKGPIATVIFEHTCANKRDL